MKLNGRALAFCLLLNVVPNSADAFEQRPSPALTGFAELVVARLQLMKGVAAYKFYHDRPIEDLIREAAVIEAGKDQASKLGIDPESVTPFLKAQMNAAKAVQRSYFLAWKNGGEQPPPSPSDLASELRPAITDVTEAILRSLVSTIPQFENFAQIEALKAHLQGAASRLGIGQSHVVDIVDTAARVRPLISSEATLVEKIGAAGVLRVGTTGDYPPFSHWNGETFIGIDIDLAHLLSADLGVEVHFVRTSWPTLMQDLAADKFDVAISGITHTQERARHAFFSRAYHTGGKAPIARCDDVDRYDNLTEIDRPGVRIIVNPGGTNERFTRANIERARIIVFEDNTEIFDEIAEGRADVMITDAIEVAFQAARDPELCPSMPGRTFTTSKKALMMPQEEALRAYVDGWLQRITATGTLKTIFEKHIRASLQSQR